MGIGVIFTRSLGVLHYASVPYGGTSRTRLRRLTIHAVLVLPLGASCLGDLRPSSPHRCASTFVDKPEAYKRQFSRPARQPATNGNQQGHRHG